jgi:hypothetical protein
VPVHPIEKLRRIWTPGREVEELIHELDPQTQLDSMMRDLLHRTIEQRGPVTLDLGSEAAPVLNTGRLRWEVVHGPGSDEHPELRRHEVSVWVEHS